ncbi:hypothetical protein jhhlp_008548 [Lomentospora prolificans]|uniref:Amine oxidase domain-containing protein n=1 Tax=Lomentospora prolificans TaxID=41688 RepID=A0A2N3MYC6_9PEZI|nr:hypothetical protein jhhlp_008548 [Lomentospora prolificans]
MRLTRVFLQFLASASAVHAQSDKHGPKPRVLERDVCIIGGGSSGTFAAVRLTDEGHSVAVIEKQDHLGGHTVTYTNPDTGKPINMGVIFFHDLPLVRDYFSRLGVEVQKADLGSSNTRYLDFATGEAVPGFEPASQEALGAALETYSEIIADRYPNISLGYELPDPVPEELLKPYSEFVEANGLQALVHMVNNIAGANGNLWERPTLYGIKVFSPMLLAAINKGFINAASGDNRDLYRGAENLLGDDVVLSSTVKRVERSGSGVEVSVDTPSGKVVVKAKKLLVAIPPIKESLRRNGFSLSAQESRLFGEFQGMLYGSTVLTHNGLAENTTLSNVGTHNPYHLLTLPGSYGYSAEPGTRKIKNYYGGTASDIGMSEQEIKDLIRGELDNLERAGNIGEGEPEFEFFVNHSPYHVHVSPEAIAKGFYRDLYELEGQRNTFWTGATFVDEDSSLIWSWTEEYLLPRILDSLA